jgi:hypothetical protein
MIVYNIVLPILFSGSMSYASTFVPNSQVPLSRVTSPSRRVVLHSESNSISGAYPLYDLLSISTRSGSISVAVTPHSAAEDDPYQPAVLKLRSESGSVNMRLPEAFADLTHAATQLGAPAREYITTVGTQAGSISGTFPLGARTTLDSHSGGLSGIELVVMPSNTTEPRRLRTASRSGMTDIRIVHDDLWAGKKEAWWYGMVSEHETHGGSINLEYPGSWAGSIVADSRSGSVSVRGRGVEIIRRENGKLIARKGAGGNDGGKIFVESRSGSIDLKFV